MKYIVLDTETNIKNTGEDAIGKNKADPFVLKNKIVYIGWSEDDDKDYVGIPDKYADDWTKTCFLSSKDPDDTILVGQNIKFDLHYLMRNPEMRERLATVRIWDTQLAEYILTGQQSQFASLDSLSEKYGGTLKDDRMKEYWNNGIDTEDIPEEEIRPYLRNDVLNTKKVFLTQIERAHAMGIMPLMATQMDALLSTIEMEFNGMNFDTVGASAEMHTLHIHRGVKLDYIEAIMELRIANTLFVVNPESKDHLSAVIFGGNLKYTEREVMLDDDGNPIVFKSGKKEGQVRTKNVQKVHTVFGLTLEADGIPTKKQGVYVTDEAALMKLRKTRATNGALINFIDMLLELRSLNKEIGTYYAPYIGLVHSDGCIHGKLNHVGTGTGRLSSSAPNLQNMGNE